MLLKFIIIDRSFVLVWGHCWILRSLLDDSDWTNILPLFGWSLPKCNVESIDPPPNPAAMKVTPTNLSLVLSHFYLNFHWGKQLIWSGSSLGGTDCSTFLPSQWSHVSLMTGDGRTLLPSQLITERAQSLLSLSHCAEKDQFKNTKLMSCVEKTGLWYWSGRYLSVSTNYLIYSIESFEKS